MKAQCQKGFGLHCWPILIFIFTCLQSCNTYNFSQPQPVNKMNLQEFPKGFQGYWIADKEDVYVQIGKQSLTTIQSFSDEEIVTGAWPRLNNNGNLVYPPSFYSWLQTIRYDSLNKPIDTLNNFLVWQNQVYHINAEGLLDQGENYRLDHDTIHLIQNNTVFLDLGHNAFLRKLKDGFYVFNISNTLIEGYNNVDKRNWWQIILLEQRDDNLIKLWYLTDKVIHQPTMFYNYEYTYYFDCRWTTDDLMQLIEDGIFRQMVQLKRVTRKSTN